MGEEHGSDQQKVDDFIYEQTEGIVRSGPFKGMILSRDQGWHSGSLSPMLLGCHESELHEPIEKEIARLSLLHNPKIVNVGCAEGYYAIGLARRLPRATVSAVDINEKCLRIAGEVAEINGVKIVLRGSIDVVFSNPDLVVMDCEGDEKLYLDYETYPGLLRSTIIVEVHGGNDGANLLGDRWERSHYIDVIFEGARNPNVFPILWGKSSLFRWRSVCENRPVMMAWLVMRPRSAC